MVDINDPLVDFTALSLNNDNCNSVFQDVLDSCDGFFCCASEYKKPKTKF